MCIVFAWSRLQSTKATGKSSDAQRPPSMTKVSQEEVQQVRAVLAHIASNTTNNSNSAGGGAALTAKKRAAGPKQTPPSNDRMHHEHVRGVVPHQDDVQEEEEEAVDIENGAAPAVLPPPPPTTTTTAIKTTATTRPTTRSSSKPKAVPPPPPTRSIHKKAPPALQRHRPHITIPKSPFLRSKQRSATHHHQLKSSEQLEMEAVAVAKKKAEEQRQRNTRSMTTALRSKKPPPKRSASEMLQNIAKAPTLHTAKRQRTHEMSTRGGGGGGGSGVGVEKKTKAKVAFTMGSICARGGRSAGTGSTTTTTAKNPRQQIQNRRELTVPRTPKFATTSRLRPPRFKPREEEEAERAVKEIKAMQQQMKHEKEAAANAVGRYPQRSTRRRPLTEPQPFSFATDARAVQRVVSKEASAVLPPPPFVFGTASTSMPSTSGRERIGYHQQEQEEEEGNMTMTATEGNTRKRKEEQGEEDENVLGRHRNRRRTTAGPMLLGGARRVLRRESGNGDEEVHGSTAVGQQEGEDVVDGMQAIIRAGAGTTDRTTLHNPLFHA